MLWSVSLQAVGDRAMTHDEIVELADAVAAAQGVASGIGQPAYGAQLVVDATDRDEASWAAGLIADALAAGTPPGEVLVLARTAYATGPIQAALAAAGITCSMSGVGQCWDNAPAESFFASLKKELVHDEKYQTRAQARLSIFEYIELFYNTKRRHSSLGYVSPAEYERANAARK